MNWTLEVVVVPVSDLSRAKEFYADKLGFKVDHDTRNADGMGIIQLTPPGSGCSIVIGHGLVESKPGSLKGLQLVVADIKKAHAMLVDHGVEVSPVQVPGEAGFRPATDNDDLDNMGFMFFNDPDGNAWAVQQISARGAVPTARKSTTAKKATSTGASKSPGSNKTSGATKLPGTGKPRAKAGAKA